MLVFSNEYRTVLRCCCLLLQARCCRVDAMSLQLLFQSENPGVELEYTVPLDNVTDRRRPEFHWKYTDWTHCTSSCGGGALSNVDLVCFM